MVHQRFSIYLAYTSLFLTGLQACTVSEPLSTEPYDTGVVVLEEGQPGKSNASVSLLPINGPVLTTIFATVNKRTLGNLLRSYTEIDGKGYLVVSQNDKVEVIENSTFRNIAIIDKGLEYPRYLIAGPPQNGLFLKGYVSYWGGKTLAPGVAVISLADRKVIKQIPVGAGPEQLVVVGDQLFVANSGGSGIDRTISVINTTTDQVVATIPVGDAPASMVYEPVGGLIHVLCSGRPVGTTGGGNTTAELIRINPATRQIVNRVTIGGKPIFGNPSNLIYHAGSRTLYFLLTGAIYAVPVNATTVSVDKPLINRSFYGLGVEPTTGIIYGADARDGLTNGLVRRYQPNGARIDSVSVGLLPNGFYFK